MVQQQTPEQCARRILKVCKDNSLRPQEQLLPQLLRLSLLTTDDFPLEALIAGLQWLIDSGSLEERGPLLTSYVLTPKGFTLMGDL